MQNIYIKHALCSMVYANVALVKSITFIIFSRNNFDFVSEKLILIRNAYYVCKFIFSSTNLISFPLHAFIKCAKKPNKLPMKKTVINLHWKQKIYFTIKTHGLDFKTVEFNQSHTHYIFFLPLWNAARIPTLNKFQLPNCNKLMQ